MSPKIVAFTPVRENQIFLGVYIYGHFLFSFFIFIFFLFLTFLSFFHSCVSPCPSKMLNECIISAKQHFRKLERIQSKVPISIKLPSYYKNNQQTNKGSHQA